MASTNKNTIVVVGATGNQGDSVARTFLQDNSLATQWHVRGTTRDPSSAKAVELSKIGAEMVTASLGSVTELERAFAGATAVFVVTDFASAMRDPSTQERAAAEGGDFYLAAAKTEEEWVYNAATAAARIHSLQRFVLSTLPSVRKLSGGKFTHVHHWDYKEAAVERIESDFPALRSKSSVLFVGSYNSNILPGGMFGPKFNAAAGRAEFKLPFPATEPLAFIDVPASVGQYVRKLVEESAGIRQIACDDMVTLNEMAATLTRVTGREFAYVEQSPEDFLASGAFGPVAPAIVELGHFIREYGPIGEKVDGWKNTLTWPEDLKTKVALESWMKEQDWSEAFA